MKNEELKKKIVEVVLNSEITGIQIRAITGGYSMANSIADTLIAAGIGDVKEAEHRAEVAERALRYACWDLTQCYGAKVRQEWADLKAAQYKNKAEKELAEEKKDEQMR